MAAVYSVEEGILLQTNLESSFSENQDVTEESGKDPGDSDKVVILEKAEEERGSQAGDPVAEAQEHEEEVAAIAAVPQIKIKEEQIEENEYITVRLNVSGEDSDEQDESNANLSGVDESTDGDWPFRCEDCSEAFGNKEAYLEHRREHTHDGPIVCLDTDSQWDDLLVSTDGGRRTLCCALCGRTFSNSRGFFTHQLKHRSQDFKQQSLSETGQSFERQNFFECRDCDKMFTSLGHYLNHERSHKQASKSVFHQLDHLKKKSFPCPTCGRCYSRASALDAHRRCHEIKLVKPQSGETEKISSDNEVTVKTEQTVSEKAEESEKKLFECLCGKSFRTMCGLGTHQRFSTTCSDARVKVEAKRPFGCSECGKTFVSSVALSCHQHWHKRRARLLGQKLKCKECGRLFTSLTFYNKHQRLAHSKEIPAKSFLNEVTHLQKKAFECLDCGLRFSRASALHSHQLCHTEEFSDIMEKSSKTYSVHKPDKTDHSADDVMMYSQDTIVEKEFSSDALSGTEVHEVNDNGFEVISITESESSESDSDSQDPDLELVCESDQDENDDLSFNLSQEVSSQPVNPEMNVKIVQINYEHFKGGLVCTGQEMDTSPPQEDKKYDCPDCGRTFLKAVSLRCHMLWHTGGMGKKSRTRRNVGVTPIKRIKCDICGHESFSKAAHHFHLGKHEDRTPYKSITYQLANLQKNSFKCEICGMQFSRLSALHSHQQHHDTKKPYACLQCNKSYANPSGLYNHRRICCSKEGQERKAEHFNPTKTLLGPKVHHCKKCGKGFWSLGAFIHHKQYQQQCADVGMDNADVSSQSERGRVRRKRRGRKRGIVNRKTGEESKEEHKCEVCGKSYRMLACFLKHQLVHNDSTPPPAKSFDYQVEQLKKNSYSCPDCGKLFSRAMALQFHMKCHGYETGFPGEKAKVSHSSELQCQTCLAYFDCVSTLQIHQQHCRKPKMESENQTKESPKDELGYSSLAQENTNVQKETSETEKNLKPDSLIEIPQNDLKYKCDDCGKAFPVVGALNIHRSVHCKAHLFKSKSEWQNASSDDFKEQAKFPFVCPECGRSFSTNAALGTHRRWHKDKRMARLFSKNNTLSKKSNRDGNFSCNLCGKQFFYLCVLRRHQKYHPAIKAQPDTEPKGKISPRSSFACTDCKELFFNESLLASHMASHHARPSDVAENADKQKLEAPLGVQKPDQPIKPVSSSTAFFKVIPTKGDKSRLKYQCTLCQKSFSNIRGVRAHKWQKHRRVRGRPPASTNGGPKPLSCSGCEKRYSSLGALFNHEKSCSAASGDEKRPVKPHLVEGPSLPQRSLESTTKCLFKCHKCGKAFPSEAQLDAHKEAARTRPHSCALCCRGYWTETQLQQHLAWHDEVRKRLPTELRYRLNTSSVSGPLTKFQSSTSPSGVNSVSLARLPTVTNSQSYKNHKCQQCGETFLSAHALAQHQPLHKNTEPYRCSLCPQTFGEIKDLIDHHQECLGNKEKLDSNLPAPVMDNESLNCIECGTSFDQETDLHQHYIEHARGVL